MICSLTHAHLQGCQKDITYEVSMHGAPGKVGVGQRPQSIFSLSPTSSPDTHMLFDFYPSHTYKRKKANLYKRMLSISQPQINKCRDTHGNKNPSTSNTQRSVGRAQV